MVAAAQKVLIIGLDAAEKDLVLSWAREGAMPTFASLLERAAWGSVENAPGLASGTVWPTFYSGVRPARTGRFRGTSQLIAGTYEHRALTAGDWNFEPFWNALSRAGKRVVVIDAPYSFASDQINGIQLVDWTSHAPMSDGGFVTRPPHLAAEVKRRFGGDFVGRCDLVKLETAEQIDKFRDDLIRKIHQKRDLTLHFMRQEKWDAFLSVFSETHCIGHQCWHLHDPGHPRYDPALAEALGDVVKDIYVASDAALGAILEEVPAGTTVIVMCSHGMGPNHTGTHLLDQILLRLEGRKEPQRRKAIHRLLVRLWGSLPIATRHMLTPLRNRVAPSLKNALVQPHKERRRFFEVITNDEAGGIRINLAGREPHGVVQPGAEYEAVCSQLIEDLMAMRNADTGGPVVQQVIRTVDHYEGDHLRDFPDLLVKWSRSASLARVESPKTGVIVNSFRNRRSGDHQSEGLFLAVGPGVRRGHINQPVEVCDFAPTVAALLGAALPEADGQPIEALDQARPAAEVGRLAR